MLKTIIENFPKKLFYAINNLEFLNEPTDFYTRLKDLMQSSKNVFISTLTFGIDGRCQSLFEILKWRHVTGKPTTIIVDKHRACRDSKFVDLIYKYGLEEMFVFYDTKVFRLFPNFLQEMFSVLHSKIFIFDDTVILSGANLNDAYFRDRMDRYIVFKSNEVAQYLIGEYFVSLKGSIAVNPYAVSDLMMNGKNETFIVKFEREEEIGFLSKILGFNFEDLYLSTAYLNFSDEHIKLLENKKITVVTSSPNTNTFRFNDKFERYVVESYTLCTIRILKELKKATFYEYSKEDFTFHCKGLWGFNEQFACSIIGSTNFNMRSIFRDIESNFLIITSDPIIINKFKNEVEGILFDSTKVNADELKKRHAGSLSRFGQYLARGFF